MTGCTLKRCLIPSALIAVTAWCYFHVDRPVARWVADHAQGPVTTNCWSTISQIGNAGWYLAGLPAAWVIFRRQQRTGAARAAMAIWLAVIGSGLAVNAIKCVAHRPRPGAWLNQGEWGFGWALDWPTAASFPSGHVTTITVVCLLMRRVKPTMGWLWIPAMAAVGIGRVMMGWHFVSDVSAGLALGWIAANWAAGQLERQPMRR